MLEGNKMKEALLPEEGENKRSRPIGGYKDSITDYLGICHTQGNPKVV